MQHVAETPQPEKTETPQTETPKVETPQQETPKQETQQNKQQELLEKQQELLNKLKGKVSALNMTLNSMSNDLGILYSGDEENAYWVKKKYGLKSNTDKAIEQLENLIKNKEQELEQTKAQIAQTQSQLEKLKQTLKNSLNKERPGYITIPSGKDISQGVKNFFDNIKKMLYPPKSRSVSSFEELKENWRVETNKGVRNAAKIAEDLRSMANDPKLLKIIDDWLDNPEKYQKQFDALPEQYKKLGEIIRNLYQQSFEIAKKAGVLDAWIDYYTPHIYADDPVKVYKLLYARGGTMGQKFSFGYQRSIRTKEDAIKLGLHPIDDPILKLQIYLTQLHKVIANKKFLEQLMNTPSEYGLPLVAARPRKKGLIDVWNNTYKIIDVPNFDTWAYVGEDKNGKVLLSKVKLKAAPEVADLINDEFAPYKPANPWWQLYVKLRGIVKRAILINPIYHTYNMLTIYTTETGFSPQALAKLFGPIPEDVEERAINAGLEISKYANLLREQLEKELRQTGLQPFDVVFRPITKVEEWADKLLWDKIVYRFQVLTFDALTKEVARQHPDWGQGQVDGVVADILNIVYGTIPQTWISKTVREGGPIAALAYKWNLGEFDPLVSAITGGGRGIGTRSFPEWERKFIGSHMRRFVLKSILGFYIIANITQVVGIMVANQLKKAGIIKGDPEPIHFMFQNESGHKLHLDFGLRANDGSKRYVVFPLFKNVQDWIGMITHPVKTIWNKMEPMLKSGFEALINYDVNRRQEIVPEGASGWQQLTGRLGYMFEQWTPSSYYTEDEKHSKTPMEWIAPFLGVWVVRGLPGGEIEQALFDFLAQEKEQKREMKNQAIKLLQKGQVDDAIQYMQSKGFDENDILDVLMEYRLPLISILGTLSYEKRLKFLRFLQQKGISIQQLKDELDREQNFAKNFSP
ncbi:MAG: hypothetical protein JHC30_06445 [Caldisericum sp.]|nr:hypothetical protein [Caldisericum sp.]